MVGLTLREYLRKETTDTLRQRKDKVYRCISNCRKYPSTKTIAQRTGLTVNQVEYVFRTFPEVREMRRRLRK